LGERLGENQKKIVKQIELDPYITIAELTVLIGISSTAIENNLSKLKENNIIRRIGGDRGGHWEIIIH